MLCISGEHLCARTGITDCVRRMGDLRAVENIIGLTCITVTSLGPISPRMPRPAGTNAAGRSGKSRRAGTSRDR